MNIRLEFDQINNYSKNISQDEIELEMEIKKLLDSLERMKNYWQGDDFDNFYAKALEYIGRMTVLCDFMNNSCSAIKQGTMQMQQQDEKFSSELQKEVAEYEQSLY